MLDLINPQSNLRNGKVFSKEQPLIFSKMIRLHHWGGGAEKYSSWNSTR